MGEFLSMEDRDLAISAIARAIELLGPCESAEMVARRGTLEHVRMRLAQIGVDDAALRISAAGESVELDGTF